MYRIVAADSRRAATGKFVAVLGNYNPHTKEVSLKKDATLEYIKKGAQPSSSVVRLLKKEGVKLPKWAEANLEVRSKKPKTKEEKADGAEKPAEPAEAKETAVAEDKEKPTEEAKVAEPTKEKDETKTDNEETQKPEDPKS